MPRGAMRRLRMRVNRDEHVYYFNIRAILQRTSGSLLSSRATAHLVEDEGSCETAMAEKGDSSDEEPSIAEEVVVTKYKMAGEIANRESRLRVCVGLYEYTERIDEEGR